MFTLNTNLKSGNTTTQYMSFNANSIARAYEKEFVATESGLYLANGSLDGEAKISSYFVTATMDFGDGHDKRLRYLYISLEADGDLQVDINTEKVSAITYPIAISTSGQQDIRIPISRALHGRFWTFKVSNGSGGADFSIDEMSVLPIIRNRSH